MAKYELIDDRYLEFVDRWGKLTRIDLDAMFFLDYTKYVEYPDISCQGKKQK